MTDTKERTPPVDVDQTLEILDLFWSGRQYRPRTIQEIAVYLAIAPARQKRLTIGQTSAVRDAIRQPVRCGLLHVTHGGHGVQFDIIDITPAGIAQREAWLSRKAHR